MPTEAVTTDQGWGVLHLFFHLRRDVLADPHFDREAAGRQFAARIQAFGARDGYQALVFSVLGQKADIGIMALGPDLTALDAFHVALVSDPLGAALVPAASYLSLTELSEYTSTETDETRRLVDEDGLAEGSAEHTEALNAFRERMSAYAEHRLHPQLPHKKVLSFYPMSKRRDGDDNWYAMDFPARKRLMAGHARVGRTYRGRVLQLITGSTGLDDWEWGVTLLADDPGALRDIVYEMRFDEVSARYGEFGPFVTGLVMQPEDLLRHQGVLAP
ncbi:heme-dependent peroxidase [soil metagenome]